MSLSTSRSRARQAASLLLRLGLVAASVWALRREFSGVSPSELAHRVQGYGWQHVSLGLLCALVSFLLLGGVELLALRSERIGAERVSGRLVMGTSFVAHALSQSIGVALLTGSAVRSRAYDRRGLQTQDIARLSAMVTLAVTAGLLAAAAVAFSFAETPLVIRGHSVAERPIGLLLAASVLAYLAWSVVGRRSTRMAGWLPRPRPASAIAQVVLASADWLVTGAVLYVFMPSDLGVGAAAFLRTYIVAQTLGMVSHVPAGAGVFEVALLGLLVTADPSLDRAAVLAAILMYRVVYYLLPLVLAMLFAGGRELYRAASVLPRRAPMLRAEPLAAKDVRAR